MMMCLYHNYSVACQQLYVRFDEGEIFNIYVSLAHRLFSQMFALFGSVCLQRRGVYKWRSWHVGARYCLHGQVGRHQRRCQPLRASSFSRNDGPHDRPQYRHGP